MGTHTTSTQLKWAGFAMLLGSILMIIRMGPVLTVLPDNMPFPPVTTAQFIELIEITGGRWQLSHIMGLLAVSLLMIGYWGHAVVLVKMKSRRIGIAAAIVATLAFGLFATALVIDGFRVPAIASDYLLGVARTVVTVEDVAKIHDLALSFFTPAVFLMFIAMGLLSSRMLHRFIHTRWLGGLGQLIAIGATTAYLFGVTGPNWNEIRIGGSAMMAGFIWHVLVGLSAVRNPTVGVKAAT